MLLSFYVVPNCLYEPLLACIASDHVCAEICEVVPVFNSELVPVQIEKVFHRGERAPLVTLNERVVSADTDKKRNRQYDRIRLAIVPVVDRASDCALKQTTIAENVRLTSRPYRDLVELDY